MNLRERFDNRYLPEPNTGCWLWLGIICGEKRTDGYGQLRVDGFKHLAHRVSWRLHQGEIPDGMNVLHKCDVTICVNPDHLFLGTLKDNTQDAINKGRFRLNEFPSVGYSMPGEKHPHAKLTDALVREIRLSKEKGITLADRYGVSDATISQVRKRKGWLHVL